MTDWSDEADILPQLRAVGNLLESENMDLSALVVERAIEEIKSLRYEIALLRSN